MKSVIFLLSLALSIPCLAQYTKTTVRVASALNYPRFIIDLRNKVTDFLTDIKINMILDVQELQSVDLNYRAEQLALLDKYDYYDMEERFDLEFQRLSKKLILFADRLDRENASIKKKSEFINEMKADAQMSIDALIERFSLRTINSSGYGSFVVDERVRNVRCC